MGRSIHAGQVSVADGTELARQKLERVLSNDPAMGVIRHVDAGYERAEEVAAEPRHSLALRCTFPRNEKAAHDVAAGPRSPRIVRAISDEREGAP